MSLPPSGIFSIWREVNRGSNVSLRAPRFSYPLPWELVLAVQAWGHLEGHILLLPSYLPGFPAGRQNLASYSHACTYHH